MTSSRGLRSQVHQFVTSITIFDETDVGLLVSTKWPVLRSLQISCDVAQPKNLQHLCHGNWQMLTTLGFYLPFASLDLASISGLAQGNWPSLEHLVLPNTHLGLEGMATLQQGKWPKLKCLDLSNCKLDNAGVAHLIESPWNQLQSLLLGMRQLSAASICQLSEHWPQLHELQVCDFDGTLKTIGGNVYPSIDAHSEHAVEPEPALLHHISILNCSCMEVFHLYEPGCLPADSEVLGLIECQWPILKSFLWSGYLLSDAGCIRLSQVHWPLLESLEIICFGISTVGMAAISSAKLPRLSKLSLAFQRLDTDLCAHLATGDWPRLERLCLRDCTVEHASMTELFQGKWPLLKVLDLNFGSVDNHNEGLEDLLASDWSKLECLELNSRVFDLRHKFDPENKVGLGMTENTISDPGLIAGGRWPHLKMLNFCDGGVCQGPHWFHNWGKCASRGSSR